MSLMDQGGGMGGGGMMGGASNAAGSMNSGMGSMSLLATPSEVKAGDVTFVAANVGSITHELIVLPMPTGVAVAGLPVAADDKVSESGSLGEASKPCGAGAGPGIGPGKAGWVSVHLAIG
ncbi:MAG: hypothetical protein M3R48_07510, partial [Candidatus Dormibacteraeota bacterium]|nr:hypothetical protein [Candidatus Dormibacteraeota bacterium]